MLTNTNRTLTYPLSKMHSVFMKDINLGYSNAPLRNSHFLSFFLFEKIEN